MAYGKNKSRKDWLMRAVPLGIGTMSKAKRAQLFELRAKMLDLMRNMSQTAFIQEPLLQPFDKKGLDQRLLAIQKECLTLNSVWREQARMRVTPALEEANKRYFRKLVGSLCFVDQKVPKDDKVVPTKVGDNQSPVPQRKYFNVPTEIQDSVTAKELSELKALGESGKGTDAFKSVILQNDTTGFTAAQSIILRFIHTRTQESYRAPDFGIADEFTLQLHIDSRMLPTGQKAEAQALRDGVAFFLEDNTNQQYHRFLDIAGAEARSHRIRIPVILSRKIAKRLQSTNADWASVIVEIAEHHVGVRLVTGKPTPAIDTANMTRVVGRDFGYTNTVSLSVVESAIAVDVDAMQAALLTLDNDTAIKSFLANNALPTTVKVIERVRYSGKAFIDRIGKAAAIIDGCKSKIDLAYNCLGQLKAKIVQALDLQPGEMITKGMKFSNEKSVDLLVREFFVTLGRISDLKKYRRQLYRKIASLKKNWFGYLSNVEVKLAKKHSAMIVREDFTVEAIEKESPKYKGRVFNKLINHGSKGQYQKRATDKFQWNGVPEIAIPSWYTSRACLTHAQIVDKKYRKGESIFLPCCNQHAHADEHAGDTIASYLFLRPKLTSAHSGTCL